MSKQFNEKLETYLLSVINGERKGKRAALLRIVLKALSQVFRTIVQLRLRLYNNGIFRSRMLGCQVLSVGNLTVGGTGKTPVVEVFARELARSGRKVAILSRGYKRKKPPFKNRLKSAIFRGTENQPPPLIVSDGERLLLDSHTSGDEPYMLASNLRSEGVAVLVDKNRVQSGRYAIKHLKCDMLILDDGFQHLPLWHELDVVLVDRTNPWGNRNVLPRGILREPIKNIKRAGFIFITKSNGDGAEELKKELKELNPHAEISECRHCPQFLKNLYSEEQLPLEHLKGLKIVAVSGIAAPGGFEKELGKLGATLMGHHRFTDHHRYEQQEVMDIINRSIEQGADAIITTEKDAVRFPRLRRPDIPLYYLRVEIQMFSGEEQFKEWIRRITFKDNRGLS